MKDNEYQHRPTPAIAICTSLEHGFLPVLRSLYMRNLVMASSDRVLLFFLAPYRSRISSEVLDEGLEGQGLEAFAK
jgi:hypothetical protein